MKRIVTIAVLLCALGSICCAAGIKVDNRLPAGNIVVEKFSGDTVYVKNEQESRFVLSSACTGFGLRDGDVADGGKGC